MKLLIKNKNNIPEITRESFLDYLMYNILCKQTTWIPERINIVDDLNPFEEQANEEEDKYIRKLYNNQVIKYGNYEISSF